MQWPQGGLGALVSRDPPTPAWDLCPAPDGGAASLPAPAGSPDGTYTAAIPGSAAPAGALVRWYVRATDSAGAATRDPLHLKPDDRQYWGAIVADPTDATSLPVLEV